MISINQAGSWVSASSGNPALTHRRTSSPSRVAHRTKEPHTLRYEALPFPSSLNSGSSKSSQSFPPLTDQPQGFFFELWGIASSCRHNPPPRASSRCSDVSTISGVNQPALFEIKEIIGTTHREPKNWISTVLWEGGNLLG